jgi:hypothetical protein
MHWLVKERFNKLNSNHYRDLTPMQIDESIRNATNVLIDEVLSNRRGFEKYQQHTNVLSSLIVSNAVLQMTLSTNYHSGYNSYFADLKPDHKYILRLWSRTDCGYFETVYTQRHILNKRLDNENTKPSKDWNRALYSISNNKIELFLPKDVVMYECFMDYIRKPKDVFFGGYDSLEYVECVRQSNLGCNAFYSQTSLPVDSEIDSNFHDLIIDYTVKELSRNIEHANKTQLINEKILTQLN